MKTQAIPENECLVKWLTNTKAFGFIPDLTKQAKGVLIFKRIKHEVDLNKSAIKISPRNSIGFKQEFRLKKATALCSKDISFLFSFLILPLITTRF